MTAKDGVSAALTTTARQVGNSLSVAFLGAIITSHTHGPNHTTLGILATTRHATATATRTTARFRAQPVPQGPTGLSATTTKNTVTAMAAQS